MQPMTSPMPPVMENDTPATLTAILAASTTAEAPVVIVPAFQPGQPLVDLVEQLLLDPARVIIVVDDGSTPEHKGIFDKLRGKSRVHLLRHAVNLGKGQALKTAFDFFLLNVPATHVGVVTADADGQHLADDICKVSAALAAAPTELVLGSRDLDGPIPWRSAFGNRLTRYIFSALLGVRIQDTQTGLRGIPRPVIGDLLQLTASRYAFELEMLVKAVERGLRVREVPIRTVYDESNQDSHFKPVRDSLRIYFVFMRVVALSLAGAAVGLVRSLGPGAHDS